MYAVVDFGSRGIAIVQDGRWSSDDKILEKELNQAVDASDPSGSDPQPHLTFARQAIELFGGKIIGSEEFARDSEVTY